MLARLKSVRHDFVDPLIGIDSGRMFQASWATDRWSRGAAEQVSRYKSRCAGGCRSDLPLCGEAAPLPATVSLGTFDADKAPIVEAKLIESKAALEAGIRAMRGNLGYYVGIDRKNNAMSNVSLWDSVEAAEQMATFQPMVDLAATFVNFGVRFQRPILNFAPLWELV